MKFSVNHTSQHSAARTGMLITDHGSIETPVFMPVGTLGTVKSVSQSELIDLGANIILGNTYHLYLRPGLDVLENAGGLHKFINWDQPMLTDSGGYQVYSLSAKRKILEEGVSFSSHIDGSNHLFTPEFVVDIQRRIGADIIMAFDECTPYPCDYRYAQESMHLTHRWLARCMERYRTTHSQYGQFQTLSPIIQGSTFPDLRIESAHQVIDTGASMNAIGGLSVGEPVEIMYEITALVCDLLPSTNPRYLMGVGTPADILECISLGIDMFDCVLPTRNARHGLLYTSEGVVNIKNQKWAGSLEPIDKNSSCVGSQEYTKGYLRHLIRTKEILGARLATLQNLSFYLNMMNDARHKIRDGSFEYWKKEMIDITTRRR
ncbi:MAG: tRNA guanosine(34) transglycosylase Tgt [Saprospiraceae bacterium]|nr:tRNA guanosine(34) transglycosylase Tgt [Saprospiraceae bacterium]